VYEGVDWIQLAQDRIRFQVLVYTVMVRIHKQLNNHQFSKHSASCS